MNNEFNNNQTGEYNDGREYPNNSGADNNVSPVYEQRPDNNVNPVYEQRPDNNVSPVYEQRPDNNVNPVYEQRPDNNVNPVYEQRPVNNYSQGNFNPYANINQENIKPNNTSPYIYPTPALKEQKPKKKRKVFGIFKLTAAALVFGIIAGAAFQGYYYITKPEAQTASDSSKDDAAIVIPDVAENTNNSDTIVPTSTSKDGVATDVSDVVDKVMPSIVAINSTVTETGYDFFGQEYNQQVQGSGSGIIIAQNDTQLLIVTNNHVVEGAKTVEIVFSDDTKATAEIKGTDSNADLAVVAVNMNDLSEETIAAIKVASLGSSEDVKAGDMAIAIGNALGYGQSVTVGYISAVNREVTIENQTMTLLQTDAAINPGNSGGALLNSQGQVIGINSVKYASEEVEGMGYAIPISDALPMINELMNRELVAEGDQGFLGIDASSAQEVTEVYAERFNMPVGVYVNDVIEKSPAEAAGLKQGDIITGIDNSKIESIDDLINVLKYKKAGQAIDLKIQVKESGAYVEKVLKVTLGERD
jgi:serine protease Do